jgi:hypothetical protein
VWGSVIYPYIFFPYVVLLIMLCTTFLVFDKNLLLLGQLFSVCWLAFL